ncbi:LysR family transcriptional regulator [Paraburkholderia rhizosphaerae]|uniref:LysR family transcriptional regulator n=2 Tax=Paraburkholderia rhizosphaerae TaxID=480658 RepID=A0A4R8LI57_9BURK|nr:LysR family transcriptional regulator [Paraburkholderia rhizosphaerae]
MIMMSKINPPAMDLNLLAVFDEIYTHRNLTRAAEVLGVTQSALSHSLRKLRLAFHDELFVRKGMSMEPTTRADALRLPVRRIMETLSSEVLSVSQFSPASAQREFSLAMVDMAEVVFLPPLMRRLKSHAPACTLRTRRMPTENIADALDTGTVELALGNVMLSRDSIYRQMLFQHDYVVLAWKRHPRLRSRISWDDFQREEHVVVTSGSDEHLKATLLEPRGIHRKAFVHVGGFLSVPWLIRGTDLIATVPTRLSEDLATAADVMQFCLPEPATPYGLFSLWHARQHNDPGHRWLRQTIFELMKHYPETGS